MELASCNIRDTGKVFLEIEEKLKGKYETKEYQSKHERNQNFCAEIVKEIEILNDYGVNDIFSLCFRGKWQHLTSI